MKDIKESWELIVPPNKRPKSPPKANWQNYFGVVEKEAGLVSIFDGDKKKKLATIKTGYAVHILRISMSGRYMYSIGRDGRATMMDLWATPPNIVAKVQPCIDARSIDTSKFKGYEDKYAVIGCYWPPSFAIVDGSTLEPLKVISTSGNTYDTFEFLREARVAGIVASHETPEFVLNIKETGYVWLVDYTDLEHLKIIMIEAERFLHDGGWDAKHRYFMPAANKRDTIVIIDTRTGKRVARIKVGIKPHPGRGANWVDPKYGSVHATIHLGEARLIAWGTDPDNYPQYAWRQVYNIDFKESVPNLNGGGQLFLKTHPNSDNIWMDFTINKNEKGSQQVCVLKKKDLLAKPTCIHVGAPGKAVHFEYNKAGDEVWVSLWHRDGAIVVYDDKTLKEKARIKGLVTPTGKTPCTIFINPTQWV